MSGRQAPMTVQKESVEELHNRLLLVKLVEEMKKLRNDCHMLIETNKEI